MTQQWGATVLVIRRAVHREKYCQLNSNEQIGLFCKNINRKNVQRKKYNVVYIFESKMNKHENGQTHMNML